MKFTPSQEARIIDMYKQGYSTIEIAKHVKCACRASIGYFLQKRGLTRTLLEVKAKKAYKRIGTKIGKLCLLERFKRETDGKWFWKCKCDCGGIKEASEKQLSGKRRTLSCGCLRRGRNNKRWLGYEDIPASRFSAYRDNAKIKGIPFEIDIKSVWDLFIKQDKLCALTGVPLHFSRKAQSSEGTASLNRIDSTKGYTLDNVQWVHKWINILKGGLCDNDLFTLVKSIYEHKNLDRCSGGDVDAAINKIPFPKRRLH